MPTSSQPSSQRARRTTQPVTGVPSRWYPQRKDFADYKQWDTHYRAFQHIYALQDQLAALAAGMKAGAGTGEGAGAGAGKGSATTGQSGPATFPPGFPTVKPTQLKDGQVLTYKAKENQFVFV